MLRKYAEITELYILWSELSRRKLSPTLASAHYSCPDNAIGIVGRQLEAVGWKFSYYYQCLCTILVNWILNNKECYTHTHPFNGHLSGTTRVSRYQKGKTNLDFTEARDSEWQWHPLGKSAPRSSQITMPVPHHSVFLQSRCPSCRPTNSVKAVKAQRKL